jgi:hypothetical protein
MMPRRLRLAILSLFVVTGAWLSSSCATLSNSSTEASASSSRLASFFDDVPAETPFVFAALEGAPTSWSTSNENTSETSRYERIATWLESADALPETFRALADRLRRGTSPTEMGLAERPRFVVYGLGPVPVVKWELADPADLRETLDTVASERDLEVERGRRHETRYRLYPTGSEVDVLLVIREKALFASVAPESASEPVLDHLVGAADPERALTETSRIQTLLEARDFTRYGVGDVDLARIARSVAGVAEPPRPARPVWSALELGATSTDGEPSEACRREARSLAETLPRAIVGIDRWTESTFGLTAGVEVDNETMERMADASGDVPGLGSPVFERSTVALGFGVRVREASTIVDDWADGVFSSPYRCGPFHRLNRWVRRIETGASSLPAWSRVLRGVGLVVEELSFNGTLQRPEQIEALLMARAEDGPTMMRQLGLFVPGLNSLDLDTEGPPVRLKEVERRISFLQSPHVALRKHLVAFSAGVGMREEMSVLLEGSSSRHPDTVAALSIDPTALNTQLPSDWSRRLPIGLLGTGEAPSRHQLQIEVESGGVFMRYDLRPSERESR